MGQTYKADFNVDNGTDYDKYNFSTSADQVEYQKNGKATNVQTELDALNTGLNTSLKWGQINNGGSLTQNVAKQFSASATGLVMYFYINYSGKYYTLPSVISTKGCCTNGIVTLDYTYSISDNIITITANVSCTLLGIYQIVE